MFLRSASFADGKERKGRKQPGRKGVTRGEGVDTMEGGDTMVGYGTLMEHADLHNFVMFESCLICQHAVKEAS